MFDLLFRSNYLARTWLTTGRRLQILLKHAMLHAKCTKTDVKRRRSMKQVGGCEIHMGLKRSDIAFITSTDNLTQLLVTRKIRLHLTST